MRIIHANQQRPEARAIAEVVSVIQSGGVAVLPTDTCYGLSADVYNKDAVQKVLEIKQRFYKKPISILVSSLDMISHIIQVNDTITKLVEKYMPGQITIVAPTIGGFEMVRGVVSETIGFRIPNCPLNQAIVTSLNKPITTSSANVTGEQPTYAVSQIMEQFEQQKFKPDIIIDAGELELHKPSTVVQVVGDKVYILRQGDLVIEEAVRA